MSMWDYWPYSAYEIAHMGQWRIEEGFATALVYKAVQNLYPDADPYDNSQKYGAYRMADIYQEVDRIIGEIIGLDEVVHYRAFEQPEGMDS